MIRNLLLGSAAAALLLATPIASNRADARAANCLDRDKVVSTLAKKYKETRRAFGLQSNMQVLELYASENGSWTAVVTTPDGTSCVVASGEAWTEPKPEPTGVGI